MSNLKKMLNDAMQHYSQGKLAEAQDLTLRIIEANPNIPQAHFLLGLIALQTPDLFMAEQAFKSAINLDEKMSPAWVNLARVFALSNQLENCQDALAETINLDVNDPRIWEVLGQTYQKLGQIEDANIWLTKAADALPDALGVNISKIFNHIYLGEKDFAKSNIDRMLQKYPNEAYLHYTLSSLEKAKDKSHIATMEKVRDESPDNIKEQFIINYALGKEYEDIDMWDEAFASIEKGAKAKRQTIRYDEKDQNDFFDYLQENLSKEWLNSTKSTIETACPIFVLGLPRTGTTLVEQILASHSSVTAAGELQHIPLLVKNLSEAKSNPNVTSNVNSIHNVDVQMLAERYMKSTEAYSTPTPHFVDKLPQNFFYIPIIAAAFPNAKIIHLRRSAMDSCYSNFKQLFMETYHYSYDQQEMARYYVNYHNMMEKWRKLVPGRIYDVEYENLVSSPESVSKAIIEHLGLAWEDSCLEFYNQKSVVYTASASQVREKAHTRSVGMWEKYRVQLKPTQKILTENDIDF